MRAIYRYVVPVDDQAHDLDLSGPIVHVASRNPRHVEVWAINGEHEPAERTFQVFGTGQTLPHNAVHVGTALPIARHDVVWHLFELLVGEAP